MTDARTRSSRRNRRLLRWLLGPLEPVAARLVGVDLNVIAITAATVMLCGIGLVGIYMSGGGGDEAAASFARRQATFVVAGLAILVLVSMVDYRRLGEVAYPAYCVVLGLLALLVVARVFKIETPLIRPSHGAWRWINLGFLPLQPSEFAKITYIIALSWYLRYRTNYRTLRGLIYPLALTLLPMFLILMEPDLGTVMLLLPVFFAVLLVAGAKRRHLLSLALICVVAAPLLYRTMHEYQRMRVLGAVLQSDGLRQYLLSHPRALGMLQISAQQLAQWENREGYQLDHSKAAIASGGFLGQGDSEDDCTQYGYLPEQHNDFIFAVIGHKWGWVGSVMVMGCYGLILVAGCRISTATNEPFGRLLSIGVVVLIVTQATVNIGMAIGLLPVTGVTLPLVSYGGSSLVVNCGLMGILLNIGLQRAIVLAPEPFIFERPKDGL